MALIGGSVSLLFGRQADAAVGDITPFPVSPSNIQGVAAGSDGNIWFTEQLSDSIGRMTPAGAYDKIALPAGSQPLNISAGPDGALWFTQQGTNQIGRMTTSGALTEFPVPTASPGLVDVNPGPDGNMWFTEYSANKVGVVVLGTGVVTEFDVTTPDSGPAGIITGPDGNLWFTEYKASKIGRITPSGTITEFDLPAGSGPNFIDKGPDGNLWFTDFDSNKIGKMTTSGTVAEFDVPSAGSPNAIAAGPDGNLWFTEYYGRKVSMITTAGVITEFAVTDNALDITAEPQGAMWVSIGNTIDRVETSVSTDNPSTTTTSTLPPGADLSTSIVAAPDPAHTHGSVTYTITVANAGPFVANNATFGFDVAGGRIVSAKPSQIGAACVSGKSKQKAFVCNLGAIPPRGSQIVTVVVEAPTKPGAMTLTGSASSETSDPNLGNNSAAQTTAVVK